MSWEIFCRLSAGAQIRRPLHLDDTYCGNKSHNFENPNMRILAAAKEKVFRSLAATKENFLRSLPSTKADILLFLLSTRLLEFL